jgi:hypothetical protein
MMQRPASSRHLRVNLISFLVEVTGPHGQLLDNLRNGCNLQQFATASRTLAKHVWVRHGTLQ